jgi:uncharacterized linocin/CFP29 family protein
MKNYNIYSYIDEYISALHREGVEYEHSLVVGEDIYIDRKKHSLDTWIEDFDNKKLFVVQIRRKVFFYEKVFTKGVLYSGDDFEVLDNEKMWDIGF